MADNIASTSHHIATYGPEELKEITGDYTDVLGRGGYGVVYKVRKMWRPKLEETRLYQVCTCLEIALRCSDIDRSNRPEISYVIEKLNEVENMIPLIQKSVYHESKNNQASAAGKGRKMGEDHGKDKEGHGRAENKHATIDNMESKSHNTDVAPKSKGFKELQEITSNFSQMLGVGGYGEVFKGYMEGKEIAVKVLREMPGGYRNQEFEKEINNLLELTHPNIIQLVGYCYETEKKLNNFTRKFDDIVKSAFCFEYAPNGSLEDYISDEANGLDWYTCYKIIMGICEGLNYLHFRPSGPIYHLDLKPSNILLSDTMTPKIADFGLSRLFNDTRTHVTKILSGTLGYMPPEFIDRGIISKEFDIFSLGVIILKLVGGPRDTYYDIIGTPLQAVIDLVHKRWTSGAEEAWLYQVEKCCEIGLKCIDPDRRKRPKISEIIYQLNEVENMIRKEGSVSPGSRNDSELEASKEHGLSGSTGTDDKVTLYVQTQGSRPRTVRACNTIRGALQSLHINFIEKDLFDRPDYAEEVEQLSEDMPYCPQVPVLSINGESVHDARELLKLHEDGELAALFQRATLADSSGHLRD